MKNSQVFLSICLIVFTLSFPYAAQAKDDWINLKSRNFFLIGNASEKDIRKVATRLEQFRETFRLLFARSNLTSPIQTNVIVFKSESSYKQFKPKRSDGKIDEFVAGYFQPGDDVNYITLSTGGDDVETYRTIFHEYVHSIVNTNFGKSEVPTWFNEGLAEYYSTFAIEDDQKVKLGLPLVSHLEMLRQSQFMPLKTLFSVSNRQLSDSGGHSRTIFYAESWALVHFLLQSGKGETVGKFLSSIMDGIEPEKAFQTAFQSGYALMEKDLKKYIEQSRYQYNQITFKNKLVVDADIVVTPLDEATTNAYLGDLLYHIRREDDAEPFLVKALKLAPNASMANVALGLVKLRQRKFDEAKRYLESAISGDQRNHMAFYNYAYLLSREGRDEFGFVQAFPKDTAAKMREALRRAIAIKPEFTESHELLAFVGLVNGEELDDAVLVLQKALKVQPGNQRYAMRIAEIYARQNKFAEASVIVDKIAKTTDDPDLKNRAENLVSTLRRRQEFEERRSAEQTRGDEATKNGAGGGPPVLRKTGRRPMSEAEIAKATAEITLRAVNESIRKLGGGVQRAVGRVQKIDCKTRPISFTVKTATESFLLTSKDFEGLSLNVFVEGLSDLQVGCGADLSALNAVISYRTSATAQKASRGELLAIDFVGNDFRLMTDDELKAPPPQIVIGDEIALVERTGKGVSGPPMEAPAPVDQDKARREMMMQSIKDAIPQPASDEKRELGYLEKIECTNKSVFVHIRTTTQTLRFLSTSLATLPIRLFVQDLSGVAFGCSVKPIEFPVVFVYKNRPDTKAKTAGTIVSMDFVPKTFVLN